MTDDTYCPISPGCARPTRSRSSGRTCACRRTGSGCASARKPSSPLFAPVKPGGAEIFRQRVAKAQIEAGYWEGKVGTVHDLRICLINNDTQILFAATYSDEFKPYVVDVIKFATPWIDHMFMDVAEGYLGLASPDAVAYIEKYQVQAALLVRIERNSDRPRRRARAACAEDLQRIARCGSGVSVSP